MTPDLLWYDKHTIFGMWFEIHTCFGMLIVKGVFLHLVHMHAHILTRQKWGGADAHAARRHGRQPIRFSPSHLILKLDYGYWWRELQSRLRGVP